ncbi:MAG: acyl-CoA dehydrogenase family protein [Gammaproteobacteria bacterium]
MVEDLNTEQRMLVDAAARFAEDAFPTSRLRARAHDDDEFAATYRRQAAALGWFALLVPEALGGGSVSGIGMLDAALVAYTRGRSLQPGGFVGANVVAAAISRAGTVAQRAQALAAIVAGDAPAAWIIGDPGGAPAMDGVIPARRAGDGWRLDGTAAMVEDAGESAWLLVAVGTADGPAHLLVEPRTAGVTFAPVESLDISRRFAEVTFDGVTLAPTALVGVVGDRALAEGLLAIASVLTVAECVGAMHQEFEQTVEYARQRIAFGRPIGSFQAIKHLLADASMMLETSKAVVLAAARQVGEGDPHAAQAASQAKAFVSDAALEHAQACFQVFGGVGYTWEHDQHLFLRRITTAAEQFGGASWHREHVCVLAGLDGAA